ncbi:hypothetical protein DFH08DRAFT_815835 [Mycena albidolilacea]|uniref:Uncharacterized protein n=1 Tax=Mycena albidolilacea TaxID=1033008 RepID=A0AAD6ZM23_9AGAR|nr:hypothetical protein DFH08DRAFT_815835 [Mycena albidolilacea]
MFINAETLMSGYIIFAKNSRTFDLFLAAFKTTSADFWVYLCVSSVAVSTESNAAAAALRFLPLTLAGGAVGASTGEGDWGGPSRGDGGVTGVDNRGGTGRDAGGWTGVGNRGGACGGDGGRTGGGDRAGSKISHAPEMDIELSEEEEISDRPKSKRSRPAPEGGVQMTKQAKRAPAQKRKEKEPDFSPNPANKNSWLWELQRSSNMSEAEMVEWESEGKYPYYCSISDWVQWAR